MGEERAEESSATAGGPRKIIHIDMDAFYASVEQRDNPELRGKPVAVGGSRERGVVAAASYEARKFGVHSAMPSITAKRKCPDLIFVKPRFDAYKAISLQIGGIFTEYTPIMVKGFGCRPVVAYLRALTAGVRKPPQEGTRRAGRRLAVYGDRTMRRLALWMRWPG
jgi:hypothetical protein